MEDKVKKKITIILTLILLFTTIANAKTKNNKFEVIQAVDQTINQTINEIGQTKKILEKYLDGTLYPKEAITELNKIQKRLINIQNQTKITSNNKDTILYLYNIQRALSKLQSSIEKMKIFIKKDDTENQRRMKDFFKSQTFDIYSFINDTLKAEKIFLFSDEIKNKSEEDNEEEYIEENKDIEDYIKMRKNLIDIKIRQQEISKETELAIIELTFNEDKTEGNKKLLNIIKKAENIKSSLQQMPIIESMNLLRESAIESWDISIDMIKEMSKYMTEEKENDFDKIMKEYKEKIEILKEKTKDFSENIGK